MLPGALYHQACVGSTDCTLTIQSSTFDDNKADGGGGAVFTTNGSLLTLPDDCTPSSSSSSQEDADADATAAGAKRDTPTKPCRSSSSFRSSGNRASFGADIASNPKRLGIASGTELAWLRQLDSEEDFAARRRLLAAPAASTNGAQRVLYTESNNRFGLEVLQLDHWGSHVVTDGAKPADATIRLLDSGVPANKAAAAKVAGNAKNSSLCAQVCEPGRPCVVGCLTGATTVAFRDGVANFSSVSLSAPANSSLKMQVTPGGLQGVPLVDVLVRVHTCGVGEFQNSAGSCEQCPAPQINLDPYKSGNCSSCPFGATCHAGFPTPLPGFWHSHQRSTLFHRYGGNAHVLLILQHYFLHMFSMCLAAACCVTPTLS
jgi:predicted outer membrane repeat protein